MKWLYYQKWAAQVIKVAPTASERATTRKILRVSISASQKNNCATSATASVTFRKA